MLCCAPSCWSRDATNYGGVPLCPTHFAAVEKYATPPEPEPVVYYVTRIDKPGLIKIGTTKDLRQRVAALGARGRTVNLVATEPGGRDVERQRHLEFSRLRVEGEWFTYAAALIVHIHGLTGETAHAS